MGGMLSLRVTRVERKRLLQLKVERGYKSVADLMRSMLGFPAWQGEGFDGADDIEDVAKLCHINLQMLDRMDDLIRLSTVIARHVGVPREVRQGNGLAGNTPPVDLELVERPLDPEQPFATRGGDKHPVLPDGFSRG